MSEVTAAAAFALGAGAATFFAPCAYALLPGYVGYYVSTVEGSGPPIRGALSRGIAASVGAIVTFGVFALIAFAAGEALERALPVIEPLVGVGLILAGATLLIGGPSTLHVPLPGRRSTVIGFLVFGAAYAAAATACVLPLFLAVALQTLTLPAGGVLLVFGMYAGSFAVLLLAVTVATAVGHTLGAGHVAPYVDRAVMIGAILLIAGGVAQLYVAFLL